MKFDKLYQYGILGLALGLKVTFLRDHNLLNIMESGQPLDKICSEHTDFLLIHLRQILLNLNHREKRI